MTSVIKLMGAGFSALQAAQLQTTPATIAGVGTAQTGAAAIVAGQYAVLGTTASSQTAFVLPVTDNGDGPYFFYNTSSTTALLFPDSGSNINGGSTNASTSVAQNTGMLLWRMSATLWAGITLP